MHLDYKGLRSSSRVETIKRDLAARLGKNYPISLYVPFSTMNMTAEDWKLTREMKPVLLADVTGYRNDDFSLVQWLLSYAYRVDSLDGLKNNLILVYKGPVSADKGRMNYWAELMGKGVLGGEIGKELGEKGPEASVEAVIATLQRIYRKQPPERLKELIEALSSITFLPDFI